MWSSIGNANSDYTSPGSVLDASFSNESCFSNSFDNVSGYIKIYSYSNLSSVKENYLKLETAVVVCSSRTDEAASRVSRPRLGRS